VEAWKWRRRMSASEDELIRKCVTQLSNVVLQVVDTDRWVWKHHSFQRYTVKSAYINLTAVDVDFNMGFNHVLWLKVIPLKINIFIWRLLLNRIWTKDNLFRRYILAINDTLCSTGCGCVEDRDHLFIQCNFYGCLGYLISGWLGFSTVHHGNILYHLFQFGGLGGFLNFFA